MKVHSFHEDLPKGQEGEKVFHEMYGGLLTRTDGRRGDLILTGTGEKVELKSEISYSSTDPSAPAARKFREAMRIPPPPRRKDWRPTLNLFVERYSSKEKNSPGGPWQAQGHGAEYYVHLFFGDGAVFAYRTDEMVKFMNENMSKYGPPFDVPNQGYNTVGFKVPRADMAHLEIPGMFPVWTPAAG